MRLRFLAIAEGSPDGEARRRSMDPLVEVLTTPALSVWVEAGTPVVPDLANNSVAAGLLLDRSSGVPLDNLPKAADLASAVIRDCWGAYVLAIGGQRSHSILCDPSGAVPVYHFRSRSTDFYASDWSLIERASGHWPKPDLVTALHWLNFPFLRTQASGASGISELIPGSVRRACAQNTLIAQLWSPLDFATWPDARTDFEEAAARLRETVLSVVPALARNAPRLFLHLSGGLDSSIVAAALSHAGVPYEAVNFSTLAADGDERAYARTIAQHFDLELQEVVEQPGAISLVPANNPLRPPPNPLLQSLHRAWLRPARFVSDCTFMDGAGGDNVFAALSTASPALDALRRKGVHAASAALKDVALRHHESLWSALRAAWRRRRHGVMAGWPSDRRFLTEAACLETHGQHPWLQCRPGLLAGSADHVRLLAGIRHFLPDPTPDRPTSLHPLLAQPIVELCLQIPSWLWVRGGRDRAVARAAFRGLVPDNVLDRRSKGTLESLFVKGYMANRNAIGSFIAEGRLAEQRIVDADAVIHCIRQPNAPTDGDYIRLLEVAAIEQWLRSFPAALA